MPPEPNEASRLPSALYRARTKSSVAHLTKPATTILPSACTATAFALDCVLPNMSAVTVPPAPQMGSRTPSLAVATAATARTRTATHNTRGSRSRSLVILEPPSDLDGVGVATTLVLKGGLALQIVPDFGGLA